MHFQGRELGLVKMQLASSAGASLAALDREGLLALLKPWLLPGKFQELSRMWPADQAWVPAERLTALGMSIELDSASLLLRLSIPLDLRPMTTIRLDAPVDAGAESALRPAPLSLIVNPRLELAAERFRSDVDSGQTSSASSASARLFVDAAMRAGAWVAEVQAYYSHQFGHEAGAQQRSQYYLAPLRLSADWPEQAVRIVIGDLATRARPLLAPIGVGGVAVMRRFSLMPNADTRSLPSQLLRLPHGAAIDIYVNGFHVRSQQLPAGVYMLERIGMYSGANEVRIEVQEPGQPRRVIERHVYFDWSLLATGLLDFEVVAGRLASPGEHFNRWQGAPMFSVVTRYGLMPAWTLGASLQHRSTATLLAAEQTLATALGQWSVAHAQSRHSAFAGRASLLGWQLASRTTPNQTMRWSLAAQWSRQSQGFGGLMSDRPEPASVARALRFGWADSGGQSWSIAASQRRTATRLREDSVTLGWRGSLGQRTSIEASLQWRSPDSEGRLRSDINLGVQVSYRMDVSDTSRLGSTFAAERGRNQLDVRWQRDADESGGWRSLEARRLQVGRSIEYQLSTVAEMRGLEATGQIRSFEQSSQSGKRSTVQSLQIDLAGGWAAAFDTDPWSRTAQSPQRRWVSVWSKPIQDSAAWPWIHPNLADAVIDIDPQGRRVAASGDRHRPPVLNDLQSDVLRPILIDAQNLPSGRSLGQDRVTLLPRHRSISLFPVGSPVVATVKGRVMTSQGPASLMALQIIDQKGNVFDLFTSRAGVFVSPFLPPGRYLLRVAGTAEPVRRFELGDEMSEGVLDIGVVVIDER